MGYNVRFPDSQPSCDDGEYEQALDVDQELGELEGLEFAVGEQVAEVEGNKKQHNLVGVEQQESAAESGWEFGMRNKPDQGQDAEGFEQEGQPKESFKHRSFLINYTV